MMDYELIKNYSYLEAVEYFKQLNGKAVANYGSQKNSDLFSNKGLFLHHIGENKIASLSNPAIAADYSKELQTPDYLVPVNYLEHLFVHILCAEENTGERDIGLDGPSTFIIPAIKNYYEKGWKNKRINSAFYDAVNGYEELFKILLERYNEAVKNMDIAFEHNITAYRQAEALLNSVSKALLILGPGIGKTTTALQYAINYNCRVLTLVPNDLIKNNWEEYDICDVLTYSAFADKRSKDYYLNIDFTNYDLIILDEAHHIGYDEESAKGAKTWHKGIKYVLDNKLCKVLGLTATEERADKINIAKTFFKDCVAEGLSIEEAIDNKVVYPFSYVTALYNVSEIVDAVKTAYANSNKETRELIGTLDLITNRQPTADIILRNNIGTRKPKGIFFVSVSRNSLDTIQAAKDILIKAFPAMQDKIKVLYSNEAYMKNLAEDNEANKRWFETTDEGFIITINMAGEGWHPLGINTLGMLRKTNSYPLYTQQLGRIITLCKYADPNAIVFDLVNNIDNICYNNRQVKQGSKTHSIAGVINAIKRAAMLSDQIIVKEENRDFVEAIKKIKEAADDSWEPWEDDIIKQYYPTEGAEGCQKRIDEEWQRRLCCD